MMIRTALTVATVLLLSGLLLGGTPEPALADIAVGATTDAAGATAQPADSAPRTLRAYWHLFAAFAFAWVLLFGYVVWMTLRLRRAEEALAELGSRTPPPSA